MPSETRFHLSAGQATGIIAVAAIYTALAWFCLQLASVHPATTPVWPPVGLAVGAVILFGRRYVVSVFLGSFVVNFLAVDYGGDAVSLSAAPLAFAGIVGVGNSLEALAAAALVDRFAGGRRCFDRVSTVVCFVICGAVIPPLFSAGFGVTSIWLAEALPAEAGWAVFLTWYTGNVVGILTVAPLIIWLRSERAWIHGGRVGESLVQLFLTVLVGWIVWGEILPESLEGLPQVYMVIPLVLWAALRLGRPVTLLSILLLSAVAVAGTVSGHEVFFGATPNHSLIYLQIFIGIITVMGLAFGSLVAELRDINTGLEDAVEERTVRLERLLREKEEILSVAVHELQSPLAGLRNLFQLLRRNPEALSGAEGGGRLVEEMEATAEAMLHQLKQLLDTQRLADQFDSRTPLDTDLGRLLEECVRMQRPTAVAKDIAIDVETPDRPVYAFTNRDSVEHVLGNLLSNAIKFTPVGKAIRVRLVRAGAEARFEVEDQGPGIPRGQLERLFEKFECGESEPTGDEASTGLGLYIAGRLVERLGGQIRCRSVDGEGSCFIFSLPFSPPRDPPTTFGRRGVV